MPEENECSAESSERKVIAPALESASAFVGCAVRNIVGALVTAFLLPMSLAWTLGFGFSITELIIGMTVIGDWKDTIEDYFLAFIQSDTGFHVILWGAFALYMLDDLGIPSAKTLVKRAWSKIEDIF